MSIYSSVSNDYSYSTEWGSNERYTDPESYNDVKDTNGNVAKADNCGFEELGMNAGYYSSNPFIAIEQQSCQFYFDEVNGIMTIDTAYDVQEVRVFIKGYEKQFQLVADEIQAATTHNPKRSTKDLKTRTRKRRTPSTFEKNFYKRYGERFHEGNESCRNDILKEIMEYQNSHSTEDWRITDRIGIYNHLFNNYCRVRK